MERRGCTRTLEQRCWVSGEWRAPATSQRPIRAGNDVEATRRPCSRIFPLLFFSDPPLVLSSGSPPVEPTARTHNLFPAGPFVSFVFLGRGKVKLLPVLLPLMLLLAAFARSRPATVFVIPVVTCGKKDPAGIYGITFPWISSEGRVTISGRSDWWSLLHLRRGSRFSSQNCGLVVQLVFCVIERLSIYRVHVLKGIRSGGNSEYSRFCTRFAGSDLSSWIEQLKW